MTWREGLALAVIVQDHRLLDVWWKLVHLAILNPEELAHRIRELRPNQVVGLLGEFTPLEIVNLVGSRPLQGEVLLARSLPFKLRDRVVLDSFLLREVDELVEVRPFDTRPIDILYCHDLSFQPFNLSTLQLFNPSTL